MNMENDLPSGSDFNEENKNLKIFRNVVFAYKYHYSYSEIADKTRLLSFKQRQILDFICGWAKSLIKRKLAKPCK